MSIVMTPGERVRAVLAKEAVDRVPLCFWHHFKAEGSGERLADETYAFFVEKFKLDIVKIMPDLPYPAPTEPLTEAVQLRNLPKLNLDTPMFREQLHCIQILRGRLGPDYPLILTLFSPLTYILQFMGNTRAIAASKQDPEAFEEGLRIIAGNLRVLISAAIHEGVSGIFFSCMGATSADFTRDEYQRFGRPHDLHVLSAAQQGWLNIVHVHAEPTQAGDQIYFDLFANYPWTPVISWSDRLTGPSLSEARTMTDKCLMGGLGERGPLIHGSETEIENEMMAAIAQAKGSCLILASGCSIPNDTPENWLHIARRLIDTPH